MSLTRAHVSASVAVLTLICWAPSLANGVDREAVALVQELRDQPRARELRCTPCALASPDEPATPEGVRRRQIYDRLDALGGAAVPALAEMLQKSLHGDDKDLTDTIFWIFGSVSGPYTDRDGKQHDKNDISAALPALLLSLNSPRAREQAARLIGAIGPSAAQAVPRLVTMLDDENRGVQESACWGLRGVDPLPALRQARSDPNPDTRQSAQHAIASIEAKCFAHDPLNALEELASNVDLICKATVTASRLITDDSFKPIDGFELREAELRVVSVVKGAPWNAIRFRYYTQSSGPLDREMPWDTYSIANGRTYLVVAKQDADGRYREASAFLPSPSGIQVGPRSPLSFAFGVTNPGVLLAADAKPHRGTTLTEAAWNELLGLLESQIEDDAVGAIRQLDQMSGGPTWRGTGRAIFGRDEALVALQAPMVSKSEAIATAAITVFGMDSPYFEDPYEHELTAAHWYVGIGKGHITGIGARTRPANPVVAAIGAKELLQVAGDGPTPNVRALAIRALGRRPHAYAAPTVAVWIRDPSIAVRRAAVLASADLPDHGPIMSASTDDEPAVRLAAALAVGFAQDPRLIPLLGKLLHDPVPDVRNAAAESLLAFAPDQAAPVMKANLASDFRPLFVNALASVNAQPYVAMLAEIIEQQSSQPPFWKPPQGWNYGGIIPGADSWQILFDFVRSRPPAELAAGKLDASLDTLERAHYFSSGPPSALYALYVSRGMVSRAKRFREMIRKSSPFDMELFFDRIDRNSAYTH